MNVEVEKYDNNMARIIFTVSGESFDDACEKAYQKSRNKLLLQVNPMGKLSREAMEEKYGEEMFWEDAINDLLPTAYEKAAKASGLEIVSNPEIDILSISTEEGVVFTADVFLKPEVTLGQYKGIEVRKMYAEVSEEEINAYIEKDRKKNSRHIPVKNRPVQEGDTVDIDYHGSINGTPFNGGEGYGFELVIGSHTLIDNFEDQIKGHAIGDEFNVYVTFPTDYYVQELSGKQAVFTVKINSIEKEELPDLDDQFASDVLGYNSLQDYLNDAKETLFEQKQEKLTSAKEDQVLEAIIKNSQMDIPLPMLELQCEEIVEDFNLQLRSQGLELSQYLDYNGMDEEEFRESLKPQAEKRIKTRLVLEAIAKAENILVSDEEIDAALQKAALECEIPKETMRLEIIAHKNGMEGFCTDLKVQKALDLVRDSAIEI